MNPTRPLALLLLFAASVGVAPAQIASPPGETSQPQPVDAREDNAAALSTLTRGLLATLSISDDAVTLVAAQVAFVPAVSPREPSPALIAVTALRDGAPVARTAVADERLNSLEEEGLQRLPEAEVSVLLALDRRVDELLVQPSVDGPTFEVDVRAAFDAFCEGNPNDELCR